MTTNEENNRPILFIDFDGTITLRDVTDAILERFADGRWLDIEKQWRAGRMGSRDCLLAQMALVRAGREELDGLIDSIQVDEGFSLLLEVCARHNIAAHIVSDGFDYCIRRILERPQLQLSNLLRSVRISASHLEIDDHGRLHTSFPYFNQACAHGCATCKPSVMRLLNRAGAPSIFVGDGLSDRYAAEVASLVFAKDSLAAYCREKSIEYVPFDELDEV
ncbi:MAG: MtnX-like HAD-IB family phosphatase, partial [Acidobacteriota bacterium]|nr:MtnX-like HAD-IB family phosphatase [Acidobacteriota bacterium]